MIAGGYYTTDGRLASSSAVATYIHDARRQVAKEEAELVGSRRPDGTHYPIFDLDYPAWMIPSGTPGHHHLYISKPTSWRNYKRVLRAMWRAGLIEWGFYVLSVKRGQAFLRVPWRPKEHA